MRPRYLRLRSKTASKQSFFTYPLDAIHTCPSESPWAAQDPKKYIYATIYGDAKSGLSPEQQVNSVLT